MSAPAPVTTTARLTVEEINTFDQSDFVARLGHLYEGSPWIVAEAWPARPFASADDLLVKLTRTIATADPDRQLALIRAHPDLVGRAALAGTLGPASTAEQAAAGLTADRLSPDDIRRFTDLNAAYHTRFGFPFVICARENKAQAILDGFVTRLNHDESREITTALAEITKIARFRLSDLLAEPDHPAPVPQVGSASEAAASVVLPPELGEAVGGRRTATGDLPLSESPFIHEISYGKREVPVYRTAAAPLRVAPIPESPFTGRDNLLLAAAIDVEVLGDDFLPAYTVGDNSMVVATDSMKNFILRESLSYPGATLEGLLYHLGRGFIATYPQLRHLRLSGRELPFQPVAVPSGETFAPSAVLFDPTRGDHSIATIELAADQDGVAILDHRCGRIGLHLMKVRGSAFTAFVRDGYTTLPERRDRPLYIFTDISWRYTDPADLVAPDQARYVAAEQVRDLAATVFDRFVSESIQHLVHEIGSRLLARFPQLAEVGFVAQNRTRDPIAESATDDLVRVYTDPFPAYGEITLRLHRRSAPRLSGP